MHNPPPPRRSLAVLGKIFVHFDEEKSLTKLPVYDIMVNSARRAGERGAKMNNYLFIMNIYVSNFYSL
jgi:hypothetical protein